MANRQFRIKRLIGQIPVIENGFGNLDLPRGYDIESIFYRLNGTMNITTNMSGAVRAESPVQYVKRIEVIADGKNTLESVRADMANRALCTLRRGQLGTLTPPTALTIAAYPVVASWVIDQAMMDGVRPKDSNLRTSGMQLLQTRLTYGQTTDCFVAGTGAGTILNGFVDAYTSELVEIPDASQNVQTRPLYLTKRSYQDVAIPATNSAQDISLPIGNVMRGVIFRAEGGAVAGEPDNTTLVNIQLRSLTDVRLNLPYLDLREANKFDYGQSILPNGYCFADLMCNGQEGGVRITEGWDLSRSSEAKATLSVVAGVASKVSLLTIELIG